MSYNPATDDVFTNFDTTYNDEKLPVYGINSDTKMLKLSPRDRTILTSDNNDQVVKAIANVTVLQRLNLRVGDELTLIPHLSTLQYNVGPKQWSEFSNNKTALQNQT